MGWKRSWAENARGNVICPMVIAWSFNKTFLWSVLELIYLPKHRPCSSLLLPVHRLLRVGMATLASSRCRSIPESQLCLPPQCTSQVLGGSVMGASERLSLPKNKYWEKGILICQGLLLKTDLSSHKQEKDIEAYLYFCPWAQRG